MFHEFLIIRSISLQIIFTYWKNIFEKKLRCWKPSYLLLVMNSFITHMTISYYIFLDYGKENFVYLHELAISESSLWNIFFIEKWIVNDGLESLCFEKRWCILQIWVLVHVIVGAWFELRSWQTTTNQVAWLRKFLTLKTLHLCSSSQLCCNLYLFIYFSLLSCFIACYSF
jgi:hypothetical protein